MEARPNLAWAAIKPLLFTAPLFAWGGMLLWFAGPVEDSMTDSGPFSLWVCGTLIVFAGVAGLIYQLMKARAPLRQRDRITEANETTFDADAAIENYLAAQRRPGDGPPAASSAPRPVFGKKPGDILD